MMSSLLSFFKRQNRPSSGSAKSPSGKSPGRGSGKQIVGTPVDVTDAPPRPGSYGGQGRPSEEKDIAIPSELPKVGLEDFDLLKVLGKGGFGKVMLVRKKGGTEVYAMKVLKKEAVVRRNQVAHTKTETHILKQIRHPFLTRMHFGKPRHAPTPPRPVWRARTVACGP